VLGHSLGGKTAMMLAQGFGGGARAAVRKLIVVDIAPIAYPAARHLRLIDAMRAVDLAAIADRAQLHRALAARIPDAPTRDFLAQNLRKTPNGYRWQLNLTAIRRNLTALSDYDNARASETETLFIAGANSNYIAFEPATATRDARPHRRDDLFGRFPNARIEVVAGAGHWVHAERPGELVELCEGFLGE
ncbi:MAG: alpha/beta fold hydrolase, partial [bacterium]